TTGDNAHPITDAGRPLARPLARPHVGSGATIPGATDWKSWVPFEAAPDTRGGRPVTLGLQVDVNTSAAGFTETPCYFAWLNGPSWGPAVRGYVPLLLDHIEAETAVGFRFCFVVLLPELSGVFERPSLLSLAVGGVRGVARLG